MKDGIIINGEFHEAVERIEKDCENCSMVDFCDNFGAVYCLPFATEIIFLNKGKVTKLEYKEE